MKRNGTINKLEFCFKLSSNFQAIQSVPMEARMALKKDIYGDYMFFQNIVESLVCYKWTLWNSLELFLMK